MTAQHCLLADGPIEGATILVAGGAGAVGHYAIELARRHRGELTELPLHRFALDDIAAAHEAVERGVTGKVLVDIP